MRNLSITVGLWTLTVLTLPITTFPFFPLGNTVVKPLSLVPCLILLSLALVRPTRISLSRGSIMLSIFFIYCVGSAMLVWLWNGNANGIELFLRALASLLFGMAFYAGFGLMNRNRSSIERTERLIYVALNITVFVAALQFLLHGYLTGLLSFLDAVNFLFVDVATVWHDRFHGLAYEPSWLASQLTLLSLPLTLSRLVSGQSLGLYRTVFGPVRREFFHFIMAVIGIFLSGSRTGLFAFAAMIAAVILVAPSLRARLRSLPAVLLGCACIYFVISRLDYVGDVLSVFYSAADIMDIVLFTNAAPRISAWVSSFNVFSAHPLFGVGLGISPQFYAENVPMWALDFSEARDWAAGVSVANPKNMILRLLSETGLIGTFLFAAFVFHHIKSALRANYHLRILAILTSIALAFDYFSMDTFALPTQWYILGYLVSLKRTHNVEGLRYYDKP